MWKHLDSSILVTIYFTKQFFFFFFGSHTETISQIWYFSIFMAYGLRNTFDGVISVN